MKIALYQYTNGAIFRNRDSEDFDAAGASLVLCFGAKHLLKDVFREIKEMFPIAYIAMCSTAGEIYGTAVFDNTISITAMSFSNTTVKARSVRITDYADNYAAGLALFKEFAPEELSYLMVLSDGSKVNGSELLRGINSGAQQKVLITGGLAGDGDKFQSTLVGLDAIPEEGIIAGIGFYGSHLHIGHGSQGGWETFGLEKTVTRSNENVLYEIDKKNALEHYKRYLGPEAQFLPGSALLFPLSIELPGTNEYVVRTILSINEAEGSMTFAGDITEGAKVRFMKANFDKITHAASIAASQSTFGLPPHPQYALLISCVGRKLILQSRIDEEVEAVDEIFEHKTLLGGFYSYGELSPIQQKGNCQLHNQTMTITTFYEVE